MSELRYEVLVNDGLRRNRDQRLPDGSPIISSPVASTLIYGERDAVLVDPPFTREQVKRVGDWIERSGKHLTAVYATHGHGDHWFGTDLLLQRFPGAVAYATDGTIAMMHEQGTVGRAELWDVDFPGQIPPSPVDYRTIPVEGIELEGQRLLAVEVGHTDTDDTTVLHVPSIGLVVAGDVAYNGVHQYLLESAHGGVDAWLARSIRSRRCSRPPSLPGTRTGICPTTRRSSSRPVTTCWTRSGFSPKIRLREPISTPWSRCIRIVST